MAVPRMRCAIAREALGLAAYRPAISTRQEWCQQNVDDPEPRAMSRAARRCCST